MRPTCTSIDVQNVVCTYNKSLFSLEKQDSDTYCSMIQPWGHCVKGKKPVTKRQVLYGSTYKIPRSVQFIEAESRMVVASNKG
jgi:hypothetical protein